MTFFWLDIRWIPLTTIEIRWHGRGGQGVVTANELLAGAALKEGKYIKAFPEFGPERMGAPIRAFTRLSDTPIQVHSQVYYPDMVVVIDPTLLKQTSIMEGLKEEGMLVANFADGKDKLSKIVGKEKNVHAVNATAIAMEEIGRPTTNTAMLGAVVKVLNYVRLESVLEELEAKFSGKFSKEVVAKNIKAVRRAYEEVD
ncbi:MAG: 2-oxoacid:acceptor oxidoreductase family protein [Methanomassiliicoccales archaeon]|nr:MAG: 2-oxoacid:acceptor oxidoreductase family protein [Methanomassiliicoccales archaeon]